MDFIDKIYKLLATSGIITPFYMKRSLVMYIFRLKYSPLFLLKIESWEIFSKVLSAINVWWTYKTVDFWRHKIGDKIIWELIDTYDRLDFCDVWCSDWSWSIDLCLKYQQRFNSYDLFDKFTWLYYIDFLWWKIFINEDFRLVYFQFACLLLYLFPFFEKKFDIKDSKFLNFTNPELKKYNLIVQNFDIFWEMPNKKYDIIKCANLLNLEYFSVDFIKKWLANLLLITNEWWFVVIIHNNNKYQNWEAVLVLKKVNWKFHIEQGINEHELNEIFNNLI